MGGMIGNRSRATGWVVAAVPALMVGVGCVPTTGVQIAISSTKFNERISADLHALSPAEQAADPTVGVFSDGSRDPDGQGPRYGSLISEIYPFAVTDPDDGPGHLVQTPCLFVGRNGMQADELRLSWEVVGWLELIGDDPDDHAEELFGDSRWVGLCTLSSPDRRVIFEDPEAPYPPPEAYPSGDCRRAKFEFAFTAPEDPAELPRNVPVACRMPDLMVVQLERFEHPTDNPDASCPVRAALGPAFAGETTLVDDIGSCMHRDDRVPACALPCVVSTPKDASYLVKVVRDSNPDTFYVEDAEHWLRPDLMVVDGQRTVVRPMEAPSTDPLSFAWHTKVTPDDTDAEADVRWAENFSPTVRVDTVQIVSRDASGADERVETPRDGRLSIQVPRFGQADPTVMDCLGTEGDAGFTFSIGDCAAGSDDPLALAALTPTYLVANLHAGVVKQPITWRASLNALDPGRQVLVKLGLRAQTMGMGLRVSPLLDLGTIPDTEYRQGEVEIENVGGEVVEVSALGLASNVGHPQDFAVFVVGDPVPMPLPIEAKTVAGGGTQLSLGDLAEAPLLEVTARGDRFEIRLGDPAANPGDPQPFVLYGEATTLRGRVLTRDAPGATFVPATSPPRPFVLPAYVEQTVPFVLRPGERKKVVIEARPAAHGLRHAELRVRYHGATNAQQTDEIRSSLYVEVVSGPLLRYAPLSLFFDGAPGSSAPAQRQATLFNAGHFDLTLNGLQVVGSGRTRFAATPDRSLPLVLPPGDYVDVRVDYLPECDGTYGTATSALDHQATLVATSDGGTARIELGGASQWFCESPP
jgi:hypothetical protein